MSINTPNAINIALAYVASDGTLFYREWQTDCPITVIDAILQSDFVHHPDFSTIKTWLNHTKPDTAPNHKAWYVGIFSQKVALNTPLKNGDRIEIYRPLLLEPMTHRKAKAKQRQSNNQNK